MRSRRRPRAPEAPGGDEPRRHPALARIVGDVAIVLAAFTAASAVAAAGGAANFGTALGFGQIGFALALVYVLVRRR